MTRNKLEIRWENPPGPETGLRVRLVQRGRVYVRKVGPSGFLTLAEAASALGKDFSTVFRWAESGRLETQDVRGRRMVHVPVLKQLMGFTTGERSMERTREALERENASLMSELESMRARLDEILTRDALKARDLEEEDQAEDEEEDEEEGEEDDEEDEDEEDE